MSRKSKQKKEIYKIENSIKNYILPTNKYLMKIKRFLYMILCTFAILAGMILAIIFSAILGYIITAILSAILKVSISNLDVVRNIMISFIQMVLYIQISNMLLNKIGKSIYPHYISDLEDSKISINDSLCNLCKTNESSKELSKNIEISFNKSFSNTSDGAFIEPKLKNISNKIALTLQSIVLLIPFSFVIQILANLLNIQNSININENDMSSNVVGAIIMMINLIIASPIVEEKFRYLVMKLAKDINTKEAFVIIIQAVFFSILHLNPYKIIYSFFAGLVFGYVLYKTNNIRCNISVHIAYNIISIIPLVIFLPNNIMKIIAALIFFAIFILILNIIFKEKKANNNESLYIFENISMKAISKYYMKLKKNI